MSHGLGKEKGMTSGFDVPYLKCQWVKEPCVTGRYLSLQQERSELERDLGIVKTEVTGKAPERTRSPRTEVSILLQAYN